MSRSNNTEIVTPSKRFYEWSGSKGCLKYFDKSKGEKGENIEIALPFVFLVLDRLHTIKGFSDADQSGFWSNEVRDLKKEPLTVRTKKGIIATGLYSTLAPVLNQGAQYCQSVYIAIKNETELEIACLQLSGSAISPWIDLCKGKDIYKYAVTMCNPVAMKKGATNYFAPSFTLNPNVAPETEAQAIELDKVLQDYLKAYLGRNVSEQREVVTPDVAATAAYNDMPKDNYADINVYAEPIDDLPF